MPEPLPPVRLVRWQAVRRGHAIGRADVRLGLLVLREVELLIRDGRPVAVMPRTLAIGADGKVVLGPAGRAERRAAVVFAHPDQHEAFSAELLRQVEQQHGPQQV